MPKSKIELPTGEKVTLIYGDEHPRRGSTYFNAVRMGSIDETSAVARIYGQRKKAYRSELAGQVKAEMPSFDAVVSPPSDWPDHAGYFREGIIKDTEAKDLTCRITREGKVHARDSEVTPDQIVDDMTYAEDGTEGSIRSLVIVDESIATGKTVAAVLCLLRRAGLSRDCEITVAVWSLMQRQILR